MAHSPSRALLCSHGSCAVAALAQDVARFLLVRGKYSWLGYGWKGCVQTPPPLDDFDHDYGEPIGRCRETAPWSGVFVRDWSRARIRMDCNTFTPNISIQHA